MASRPTCEHSQRVAKVSSTDAGILHHHLCGANMPEKRFQAFACKPLNDDSCRFPAEVLTSGHIDGLCKMGPNCRLPETRRHQLWERSETQSIRAKFPLALKIYHRTSSAAQTEKDLGRRRPMKFIIYVEAAISRGIFVIIPDEEVFAVNGRKI